MEAYIPIIVPELGTINDNNISDMPTRKICRGCGRAFIYTSISEESNKKNPSAADFFDYPTRISRVMGFCCRRCRGNYFKKHKPTIIDKSYMKMEKYIPLLVLAMFVLLSILIFMVNSNNNPESNVIPEKETQMTNEINEDTNDEDDVRSKW